MMAFTNRSFKAAVIHILEDLKETRNIMMRERENIKITQWNF